MKRIATLTLCLALNGLTFSSVAACTYGTYEANTPVKITTNGFCHDQKSASFANIAIGFANHFESIQECITSGLSAAPNQPGLSSALTALAAENRKTIIAEMSAGKDPFESRIRCSAAEK